MAQPWAGVVKYYELFSKRRREMRKQADRVVLELICAWFPNFLLSQRYTWIRRDADETRGCSWVSLGPGSEQSIPAKCTGSLPGDQGQARQSYRLWSFTSECCVYDSMCLFIGSVFITLTKFQKDAHEAKLKMPCMRKTNEMQIALCRDILYLIFRVLFSKAKDFPVIGCS